MKRLHLVIAGAVVLTVGFLAACSDSGPSQIIQTPAQQQQSKPTANPTGSQPHGGSLRTGGQATITAPGSCPVLHVTPSLYAPSVGCVHDGTKVSIVAGPTSAEGSDWWEIKSGDTQGWLQARLLSPSQ